MDKKETARQKILEKDVQNSICEYLAWKRHFFWRVNTVGMYDPVKKIYRRLPKWAKAGVPDIIVIIGGQIIGLECKGPDGKQTPSQKLFQKELTDAGGIYKVVKGVPDVQELGL